TNLSSLSTRKIKRTGIKKEAIAVLLSLLDKKEALLITDEKKYAEKNSNGIRKRKPRRVSSAEATKRNGNNIAPGITTARSVLSSAENRLSNIRNKNNPAK